MQRQDHSKIKELLRNLLRIIAKLGELDDLKGGNPKALKTEVLRGQTESLDSGTTAVASEAPSVGSNPAFFVTDTDFAYLAASLLSMVNDSYRSVLPCPVVRHQHFLCLRSLIFFLKSQLSTIS